MNRRLVYRVALGLLLIALIGTPAGSASRLVPRVGGFYERWLAAVEPRLGAAERLAFAALADDVAREIFVRRFWQARGGEGPLARFRENFDAAERRHESFADERARALLVAGKPATVTRLWSCEAIHRPLEIWIYTAWHAAHQRGDGGSSGGLERDGFALLFYRDSDLERGRWRQWAPDDGTDPLTYGHGRPPEELAPAAAVAGCFTGEPRGAELLARGLSDALSWPRLRAELLPPAPDPAWLDDLAAELAARPAAVLTGATLAIEYPGRYGRRTVVHGRVGVPLAVFRRNAEGLLYDRLAITGDIWHGDRLVDSFAVVHYLAGAPSAEALGAGTVGLDFYRRLRPGTYRLDLRAADHLGRAVLRQDRPLTVPLRDAEAIPPPGRKNGFAGLTRPEVGMLTTFPSVELLLPESALLAGGVELGAATSGGPIDRVDFLVDGAPAASDAEPPYAAVVDLGATPSPRQVTAVARDASGGELARDVRELNQDPARLAVRLLEPIIGGAAERARVEVDVPAGAALEAVDIYVDETLVATLAEPPFVQPLPAPGDGRASYVRAVARLADGRSAEDLALISSRVPFDEIDVRRVSLYVSVVDRRGRLVRGLAAEELRVLEDGHEQAVERFASVDSLAINVAMLMDISSSMRRRLGMASRSAHRFFDTVMRPEDRASLVTFHHDIRRVVPFTNDVELLGYGADGYGSWGTTRLHDALIYTLHAFGGVSGRRALVLLSDGRDVDSDFDFKQVLAATLRAGVTVYPILLDVVDERTRGDLERLAEESGGRFFELSHAAHLAGVYRQLEEELRSQYLIVYDPPAGRGREFRRVEVEVARPGLRARTLTGYFPD